MGTIYIGICHDDYLVITQLCYIKILMDSCSECCNHGSDFCIVIYTVKSCLFNIQYLASQR